VSTGVTPCIGGAWRLGDQTDGFLEFLQSRLYGIGQFVYVAGDLGASKTWTVRPEIDKSVKFEWLSLSLYLYNSGDYRCAIRKFFHFES